MLKQDVSLSDLEFITDLSPSESDSVSTSTKLIVYFNKF